MQHANFPCKINYLNNGMELHNILQVTKHNELIKNTFLHRGTNPNL